jgi:broad specificity phosphatase PhoE
MRLLYLVRHASPSIQPNVPTVDWTLSERGITEAQQLSEIAKGWDLQALYSSIEPKAQATALIIGDATGLPVRTTQGFEELRFDHWIGNSNEFSEIVRSIFEQPSADVRGAEGAGAAAERFAGGVRIVAEGPFPAAIVSHGRILTAYLADLMDVEAPFETWRSIPMPGWCRIDLDAPRGEPAFEGLPSG